MSEGTGVTSPEAELLRLSLVLILLVFRHGITLRRGLVAGIVQRQRLDTLAEQVRLQQIELHAAERERTILNERQRLLRDLHDGVGASLISALKMIERGRLSLDDAATVLRECLDDLRLVVDSLEPLEHDLVTLLASLRYRLGDRLERAGIAIDWEMGEVPPLPWLDAPAALEVLRILQELLTNILKHARATRVRISVSVDALPAAAAMAVLRVEDNGIGFDPQLQVPGRGLAHLRHRAARLAARIEIDAVPGRGTCVRLVLPLEARMAPGDGL